MKSLRKRTAIILLLMVFFTYFTEGKDGSETGYTHNNLGSRFLKEKRNNDFQFPDYPFQMNTASIWDYFGTLPYSSSNYPAPIPPMPPMPPSPPNSIPFSEEFFSSYELTPSSHSSGSSSSKGPTYVTREIVVTAYPEMTCPKEFALSGGECIKIDQKPSKLGCKEGWSFENGVCNGINISSPTRICETGYEMTEDGECSKTIVAPHQIHCPSTFTLGEKNCYKHVYTEVIKHCPQGYLEDQTSKCVREDTIEPIKMCHEDLELIGDYCRSEKTQPPNYKCNNGFTRVHDACERVDQMKPQLICPSGFVLTDGFCKKFYSQEGSLVCERGVLQNSMCTEKATTPIIYNCPNGYYQIGNFECESIEKVSPTEGCPKFAKFNPEAKTCTNKKSEFIPLEYSCPYGFYLNEDHMCSKTVIRSASESCGQNYKLDKKSNTCINEQIYSPKLECPEYFEFNTSNMKCEKAYSEPITMSCIPGFTFDNNSGMCTMLVKEDVQPYCTDSYTLSQNKSICANNIAFQPFWSCPSGYTLEESRTSKVFRGKIDPPICKGQIEAKMNLNCPHDFKLDSTGSQCLGTQIAVPNISCPMHFSDINTPMQCTQEIFTNVTTACPRDFQLMADQCVKILAETPLVMCPVGYRFINNVCIKELHTSPTPQCPSGYTFDNLVGTCFQLVTDYSFANIGIPNENPSGGEALLDLEQETTTSTTPSPPPEPPLIEPVLPSDTLPPSTLQIVQQPVPIPSPVVYLPAQAPIPPPPNPVIMPFPVEKQSTPLFDFNKKVNRAKYTQS